MVITREQAVKHSLRSNSSIIICICVVLIIVKIVTVLVFENGFSIEGCLGLVGAALGFVFGGEGDSFEDKTNDFPLCCGFL